MRTPCCSIVLVMALCGGGSIARGDVWDVGSDNDDTFTSDNELVNGLDQVHDMAAQQGGTVEDEDWYPFQHFCNNSYEILLDGITGGVGNVITGSPFLEVLDSDHTSVIATSEAVSSLGIARRINVVCLGSDSLQVNHVRVSKPGCSLSCVDTDQYHIHFRDTTALVPRFNNSATQVSILVLQNSTSATVATVVLAYDATGTTIGYVVAPLDPNQVTVVNLSTANAGVLAGKSGGLKIINGAPYGALAGKVVAVEPATGFTFDTPLVYKPPEE